MSSLSIRRAMSVALTAAVVTTAGCDVIGEPETLEPPTAVNPMFLKYVSLGNSLTAGFQSLGINDSTQQQAYPVLLADMMETEFTIPAFTAPGCPPPYVNFFTQQRIGGLASDFCALRRAPVGGRINNVAVPGAALIDAITNFDAASDPNELTTLILGGRSQLEAALDAGPTFVTVALGSNDILGAALDFANPGNPALVTPPATFAARYATLLDSLEAAGTVEGGALIAVQPVLLPSPSVNSVPFFTAGAAWEGFEAVFDGLTAPLNAFDVDDAACATAFVPFTFGGPVLAMANAKIDSIQNGLLNPAALQPATITCADNQAITAAEWGNMMAAAAAYNAAIQQEATARGWLFFDPAPVFNQFAAQAGTFRPFPAFSSTDPQHETQPFGAAVSRDGFHWSATLHSAIADALWAAILDHYEITVP